MANNSGKRSNGKKGLRLVKKLPNERAKVKIYIEIVGDKLLLEKQLRRMDIDGAKREFNSEIRDMGDIDLCVFDVELI